MQMANNGTKPKPVILFADDDPVCLDVGIRMLQRLGYHVLNARNGKEVISIFRKNQNKVDLVLLDMKMPHNGGKTFDQLKQIKRDVKVLIVSGYTEDYRVRELLAQGCNGFLQKPFMMNVLSQKIADALKN